MGIVKAVLPVIAVLLIGMFCREKRLISEDGINGLQSLVVNFTLPATLFGSFYKTVISADSAVFPLTMFIAVSLGILFGRILCSLFNQKRRYNPFFVSGYEAGMLGFALMAILAGSGNISTFAMLDVGQDLAIFTVYLTFLKKANGESGSFSEALRNLVRNPGLVSIVAGAILGITGIGLKISRTAVGPVIDALLDFIAAPTGAIILIVIGYRMDFRGIEWKTVLSISSVRILVQALFAAAAFGIYRLLGGIFTSALTTQSLIMMFILPPPFVLPLYIAGNDDKKYYSSAISVYTLVTVAFFIILISLTAA